MRYILTSHPPFSLRARFHASCRYYSTGYVLAPTSNPEFAYYTHSCRVLNTGNEADLREALLLILN